MFIVFTNEPPPLIPPQGGKAPTNQFILGIIESIFENQEIIFISKIKSMLSVLSAQRSMFYSRFYQRSGLCSILGSNSVAVYVLFSVLTA